MIAIVQATIKRKAEQEAAVPRGNMAPSQFDHSGYSNYTPVSTQGEDQHSIDNTSMPSPSSDSELINTPAASDDYGTKQDNIEHGSLALQTDPPPEYQVIKYCYGPKREYEYKAANGEVEPHMNGSITLMQRLRDARRARRMARRLERRRQRKFTKGTLFIAIVKFILLAGLVHLLFQDIFRSGKWGFRHEDEDHRDEHYENSDGSIPTSRETIIYNRDGAIRGQYALYDLLSLHTMSGSIAVVIDPQPADPDHPTKPAKVLLSTRSGSISVHFRLPKGIRANEPADLDNDSNSKWTTYYSKQSTSLAPRPYSIDIQTQSGSITADIAFSTDAQLSTSSGNINARLTPLVFHGAKYIHGHKNVSIITDTKSGSTDLKLTEPLIFPAPSKREGEDGAIEQPQVAELRSTSASGAIRVMYPPSWAGHVYAVSVGSGRTRVGGRGLRIIKQGRNAVEGVKEPNKKLPKGKQWWGSKGDSNVQLEAKSGAVEFWVKDD